MCFLHLGLALDFWSFMWIDRIYLEREIKCATSVEAKPRSSSKIICAFDNEESTNKFWNKNLIENPILLIKREMCITDICCNASSYTTTNPKDIGACERLLTNNILHQVELQLQSSSDHPFHWGMIWNMIWVGSTHWYLQDTYPKNLLC